MIEKTTPNGPADKAGLRGVIGTARRLEQVGDLIVAINDEVIDTVDEYERAVRALKPGEQVKLRILRIEWTGESGQKMPKESEREVTLTVGST